MQSVDGKLLLVYIRNLAGVPRLNTRVRSPRPLGVTLKTAQPGPMEVWDLDAREVVRRAEASGTTRIDLGETAHDYALVVTPIR